jgi:hypothetical protein
MLNTLLKEPYMRFSKPLVLIGVFSLALMGTIRPVFAQAPGGPTSRPFGGRGNFDPSQIQKMISDRIKEEMGVSDEDWAAIEPRLMKVMAAQTDARGGGMGMGMLFGGGRGGPGGPGGFGAPTDDTKLSPTAKAAKDLQASIDANAGPNELATRMAAYRDAQAKALQALADARASLKEVLTHKQEAVLLMLGILD